MILWLFACVQTPDCASDETLQADGGCGAADTAAVDDDTDDTDDTDAEDTDPATVSDVLDALPACEPAATDGRIDLDAGCADGMCAGMTYAEIVAALDDAGACDPYSFTWGGRTSTGVSCYWSQGLGADFDDDDADGVPDEHSTIYSVSIGSPYDGGTPDGLGIGATLGCYVDVLGAPDSVEFDLGGKDWTISYAYWSTYGVAVSDYYDDRGNYEADGYVDSMSIAGMQGEL
jgi:hypothetical protein